MNTTIFNKVCQYEPCSKEFETGTERQKTCSHSCGGLLRGQKRKKKEPVADKKKRIQAAINRFLSPGL